MRHAAILATLLLVLTSPPAWAGFAEGQARFQGGDYKGALDNWLPLAEQGDARAQYSVGILYEQGLGVAQDLQRARDWYAHAKAQGYGPAEAALRALQPRMQPPQASPPRTATPSPQPPAHSEKEQIERMIMSLLQQANLQLRLGHLDHAAVEVNEVADGFDVAVRGLVLSDGPAKRLEIGDVAAHITRKGSRYYIIDFRLPVTLRGFEPGAKGPALLNIPRQRNRLTWDRDLGLVVAVDMLWEGLTSVSPDNIEIARINRIAVVSDLTEKAGLWSGPVDFSLEGLSLQDPDRGAVQLGRIRFRSQIDKLDMVRYAELSRAVTVGGQTPQQTVGEIRNLLSGIALEFELSDLRVAEAGGLKASLDKASYRIGLKGFDQPLATIDMGFMHQGLRGQPPAVPEMAPTDARLHLVFERLPMETLLRTGVAAIMEYVFFGEVGKQGDVMNQLRQSFSDAGTRFHIIDGRFEGPKLLLTVAGLLAADAQAFWGLSGTVDVSIRGIDSLASALEPASAPAPAQANQPSAAETLRSFGKLGADGQTYSYRFELNRQGQFLVNGQPATPLLGLLFRR